LRRHVMPPPRSDGGFRGPGASSAVGEPGGQRLGPRGSPVMRHRVSRLANETRL
jgi:hypothetical protein